MSGPMRSPPTPAEAAVWAARLAAGAVIDEPVAVVVAHPDDETLGCGAALTRLRNWRLIHLTDGAPSDGIDAAAAGFASRAAYADARWQELGDALRALRVEPQCSVRYGWPDQELGAHLEETGRRLALDIDGMAAVVTHAYEHGHPDHDGAAFCVHAAAALLARSRRRVPALVEFAGYHWHGGELVCGRFWPDDCPAECLAELDAARRRLKTAALACFASQQPFLARFPVAHERFRPAPVYDFAAPAPPREAFFERLGWRATRVDWYRRAANARSRLGLDR